MVRNPSALFLVIPVLSVMQTLTVGRAIFKTTTAPTLKKILKLKMMMETLSFSNVARKDPDYDPDTEYVSRENRPEWDTVGLMGKLRIRKGQVTGTRWIKMRNVSATVEEWLVR